MECKYLANGKAFKPGFDYSSPVNFGEVYGVIKAY